MPPSRTLTPVGYTWLARHFEIDPIPHFVESFIAQPGQRRSETRNGRIREIHPHTALRLETVFDHLDFALKREGLHLELLRLILPRLSPQEVAAHVRATPTGANARRLWHLHERFTKTKLPLPDLRMGNYIDLADPRIYYCGPVEKMARWRINRNILHDIHFSPMLRRTPALVRWEAAKLHERCADLVAQVPPEVFQRALRFLYAKETRTSYAIERETPSQKRAEAFMALLAQAGEEDFLDERKLVALQRAIVDPRFACDGWRTVQNYVGRTLAPEMEEVHLIPPKPEDLGWLMISWLRVSRWLADSPGIPPIAAAAIVAWLFVYFHPFEDGNGRIHRFLIHHVLARRKFGPPGVLLPVSAVMLARPADYDASLEVFSRPLNECTDYSLDQQGAMTVAGASLDHFRYIDCTAMAEALYSFLAETIEKELPAELAFLQSYDRARIGMREVVELPEPAANLFLRLCFQNGGTLSKPKRKLPAFARLTAEEIDGLEAVVAEAYATRLPPPPAK